MNLDLIHNDFPIWEVTDWQVPDIDYTQTHAYDQSSKHYKSSDLRHTVNTSIDMYGQGFIIEEMLRKDNSQTAVKIFNEIESNKSIAINCCEELLLNKEIFLKAFKNLKVVIVLRHPVDIIFSWHRTKRGERYGRDKRFVHQTYGDDECPIQVMR